MDLLTEALFSFINGGYAWTTLGALMGAGFIARVKDTPPKTIVLLQEPDVGEPTFVIRGSDFVAPAAIRFWADMTEIIGLATNNAGVPEVVEAARELAREMYDYQQVNGSMVHGVNIVVNRRDHTYG